MLGKKETQKVRGALGQLLVERLQFIPSSLAPFPADGIPERSWLPATLLGEQEDGWVGWLVG